MQIENHEGNLGSDSVTAESRAETPDINTRRLAWLHSPASGDVGGYEWGIFRVKWESGRAVQVLQTNGDFSDLDAAIQSSGVPDGGQTV